MYKTVAEAIKQARTSQGMTQKELAYKCGMADSAIRKYESGRVIPKIETRKKIANALNIEIQELMSSGEIMSERLAESINKAVGMITSAMDENNRLIAVYRSMNEVGRSKAMALIEDLAKIPEYQESSQNSSQRAPLTPDETEGDPFEYPEPVESKAED